MQVLQGKMRSIKQHAEQLLDDILTHPNMTAPQVNTMTDLQKRELREKVKAADDVSCTCQFCMQCGCHWAALVAYRGSCYDLARRRHLFPLLLDSDSIIASPCLHGLLRLCNSAQSVAYRSLN